MYTVKSRYYANKDMFGESFILTSDNGAVDLKLEIGDKVNIVPARPGLAKISELVEAQKTPTNNRSDVIFSSQMCSYCEKDCKSDYATITGCTKFGGKKLRTCG